MMTNTLLGLLLLVQILIAVRVWGIKLPSSIKEIPLPAFPKIPLIGSRAPAPPLAEPITLHLCDAAGVIQFEVHTPGPNYPEVYQYAGRLFGYVGQRRTGEYMYKSNDGAS